ncbi:MAG TPA: dihydrofolate reductase family protein [Allosphingosinicella sp.]|jgi:dihydrofolate reductase
MSMKIIATDYVSLDGIIEDPVGMEGSGLGNWTGPHKRGPRGDRFKHDELFGADALIFGRVTFEAFGAVWPTVDDAAGYAARMNGLPKFVASRTLTAPVWSNSLVLGGDLVDAISALKRERDGTALIFGSASIVHALARHRLIDGYNLMVYPILLGRGTRLFPDGPAATMTLVENVSFDDGIVLLRYAAAMTNE